MRRSEVVKEEDYSGGAKATPSGESNQPRRALMFRALRHRNYQLFWTGSFLSNIGTWMQTIAQGWLVRELTPSPFLIGFIAFAGSFPQLAFALLSGVYADIFDRHKLLLATQMAQMICALILGTLVWLKISGLWPILTIWHVIAVSFASGLASTLSSPTYHALTLDIVGREDLMSAIALNSAQFNLSRIVGPTIGGLMLGAIGMAGCFFLNGLSFLAVILALMLMRFPAPRPHRERNSREVLRQMMAGLRYVRGRPRVLALLTIATVTSIFGLPYLTFLPIFARDVLGQDATGLAYLMAATGAGAVTSALLFAFLGDFRGRGRFLLGGTLLFGATVIVFALSHSFARSFICLMLVGAAMVSITATVNTLLQTLVIDEMRGRVMSLYSLTFLGLAPIGSLLVGTAADLIGARSGYHGAQLALAASGGVIIIFVIYILIAKPRVRALE
jgi:MFS family permease